MITVHYLAVKRGIIMSKNHQFFEFDTKIVERWVKTVPHMVSGKRFNPYKPDETIDFVLKTDPSNFNYDQSSKVSFPNSERKVTFAYEDEVLELYSDNEVRLFQRLNRGLIERGLLKRYEGTASSINAINALSDEEVEEIAGLPNLLSYKKRLNEITSVVTIERVMAAVIRADRKASFVTAAQERKNELNKG